MNNHLLIKTQNNWADEIDTEGFAIFTKEAYFSHLKQAEDAFAGDQEITIYVGTNEDIQFPDYKDYVAQIEVQEVNFTEVLILCKAFGIKVNSDHTKPFSHYGLMTLVSSQELEDYIAENDDEEYEEEEDSGPFGWGDRDEECGCDWGGCRCGN